MGDFQVNLANQYLNLKPKLRTLEILIVDVWYVVMLIYTLNLHCELTNCHHGNNYFPFYDNICSKRHVPFMFYSYHGVYSNNYFKYDTFYN